MTIDNEKLNAETNKILKENPNFYVDFSQGHRNWKFWEERVTQDWAKSRAEHNSHLIVIRKRRGKDPEYNTNFGKVAMLC